MNHEARTSATPLVDVRGVHKRYGRRSVLHDVGLRIDAGEVVGLVGPNGAGKSTLIRILSGMSTADAGLGSVLGEPLGGRGGRVPFIGMMIERPSFIETLSARRNLELLFGIRGHADREAIESVLARVGLDARDPKPVKSYSLGMRQRLSLAQAIGEKPALVIFDEPTNGLDPTGIIEMREIVRSLARDEGMGVLLASHLLSEVETVCDRVVMLGRGTVQRTYVPADEARRAPVLLQVSSAADLDRMASVACVAVERHVQSLLLEIRISVPVPVALRQLVMAGVSVEGIQRSTKGLERVYLEAVDAV